MKIILVITAMLTASALLFDNQTSHKGITPPQKNTGIKPCGLPDHQNAFENTTNQGCIPAKSKNLFPVKEQC